MNWKLNFNFIYSFLSIVVLYSQTELVSKKKHQQTCSKQKTIKEAVGIEKERREKHCDKGN